MFGRIVLMVAVSILMGCVTIPSESVTREHKGWVVTGYFEDNPPKIDAEKVYLRKGEKGWEVTDEPSDSPIYLDWKNRKAYYVGEDWMYCPYGLWGHEFKDDICRSDFSSLDVLNGETLMGLILTPVYLLSHGGVMLPKEFNPKKVAKLLNKTNYVELKQQQERDEIARRKEQERQEIARRKAEKEFDAALKADYERKVAAANMDSVRLKHSQAQMDEALGEAIMVLEKEPDNREALRYLGMRYAIGEQVAKNPAKAVRYFRRLDLRTMADYRQLDKDEMWEYAQALCADDLPDNLRHPHRARILFEELSDYGWFGAGHMLGWLHLGGAGHEVNTPKAFKYFAQEARRKFGPSVDALEILVEKNYHRVPVTADVANIRAGQSTSSEIVGKVKKGEVLIDLRSNLEPWWEVYVPGSHLVGFIHDSVVDHPDKREQARKQAEANARMEARWPAQPAAVPGQVRCNTRCTNADCFRTYSDGRRVRFQARQVWDPFTNSFKFDSGSC